MFVYKKKLKPMNGMTLYFKYNRPKDTITQYFFHIVSQYLQNNNNFIRRGPLPILKTLQKCAVLHQPSADSNVGERKHQ